MQCSSYKFFEKYYGIYLKKKPNTVRVFGFFKNLKAFAYPGWGLPSRFKLR